MKGGDPLTILNKIISLSILIYSVILYYTLVCTYFKVVLHTTKIVSKL